MSVPPDTVYFGESPLHEHHGPIDQMRVVGFNGGVAVYCRMGPEAPWFVQQSIPAGYSVDLALALVRQSVPHLLELHGFGPETPWWVLADKLEEGPHGQRVEAALLRLAFDPDYP